MRHRRRNGNRKQFKIMVVAFTFLVIFMGVGYAAFETKINITAKGNVLDTSRVIKSWSSTDNGDFHSSLYKNSIVSATFVADKHVDSSAVESWDVSADGQSGVMAWVVQSSESTPGNVLYDLYIGANKGVIANANCGYLFGDFSKLKTVDFSNNFDMANVTSTSYMFKSSTALEYLDVSSFEMEKVNSIGSMFEGCSGLKKIDGLNKWTTNAITSMVSVFSGCSSLEELDLSTWVTSEVTSMASMFARCSKLKKLNLCSFDTSKVSTMQNMFNETSLLEKVYVGPNWALAANTTDMFANRGSLPNPIITGECGNENN